MRAGGLGGREEERTAILRLEEESGSGGWRQVLVEQVPQSPISDSASNACHVLAPSVRLCLSPPPVLARPPFADLSLTYSGTHKACRSVLITSRAVPRGPPASRQPSAFKLYTTQTSRLIATASIEHRADPCCPDHHHPITPNTQRSSTVAMAFF